MATKKEKAFVNAAIANPEVAKKILDIIDWFEAGGGGGGSVISINGEQGVVVLNTDDISEGSINEYYTEAKVDANVDPKIQDLQDQIDNISAGNKYEQTFSAGDWDLVLGSYELQIPISNHNKGLNPESEVYEANGGNYDRVSVFITNSSLGDVTLQVSATPDNRFTGKIVII